MNNETPQQSASLPVEGGDSKAYRPLRIWPALLLLVGMVVAKLLATMIDDGPPQIWMVSAFGPLLFSVLLVLVWWLGMSRAKWGERLLGLVGIVGAFALTMLLMDASMRGPAALMLTVPMGAAAFTIGAILFHRQLSLKRTVIAVVLSVFGFGFSTLLVSDGMWGDFALALKWRWEESAEDKLIANVANQTSMPLADLATDADLALLNPEWPAFRGADRTGTQTGSNIQTDWASHPPKELWRVPMGPGWSSFAVAGSMLFTQEQRKEDECVVCYDADSGREVWATPVKTRLVDPLGGPGPRATPALSGGAVFTLGSMGHLLRLDARTGEIVWQKNLCDEADRKPPMWGYCSSPLVVGSTVIVHAGGAGEKGTMGFDVEDGHRKWSAASGEMSYSSPQLCTVAGEQFLVMLSNLGVELLDPNTGAKRLDYSWTHSGYRALQTQVVEGDSLLLPTGIGAGTRRVQIANTDGELAATEVWTTRNLKPDFNDLVVHEGYAYGFDGTIFACIDLATGAKKWKKGRYGKGQVLLLSDIGVLFVITEKGQGVLVKANPAAHTELAKMQMLNAKTWNHPVVVGDRLYLRNSEEAVCYQLALQAPVIDAAAKESAVSVMSE